MFRFFSLVLLNDRCITATHYVLNTLKIVTAMPETHIFNNSELKENHYFHFQLHDLTETNAPRYSWYTDDQPANGEHFNILKNFCPSAITSAFLYSPLTCTYWPEPLASSGCWPSRLVNLIYRHAKTNSWYTEHCSSSCCLPYAYCACWRGNDDKF